MAYYVLYDPWTPCKINDQTTWSRVTATHVVPDDIPPSWVHNEEDVERTPRNESYDYNGYIQGLGSQLQTGHVPGYLRGPVTGADDYHASSDDKQSGGNQPTGGGDDASTIGVFSRKSELYRPMSQR